MRNCFSKSCNPLSLICATRLCHKSGEVSSSTTFSCPLHTFACVLYNEQHNLAREIRFRSKSRMCRTSFNVNVHLILDCMQMSPILAIWETILFPIFIVPKSPAFGSCLLLALGSSNSFSCGLFYHNDNILFSL